MDVGVTGTVRLRAKAKFIGEWRADGTNLPLAQRIHAMARKRGFESRQLSPSYASASERFWQFTGARFVIKELVLRFLAGGVIVSLFAMLGGALKPKSFAGLLGAAPSVALATLTLTVLKKGKPYAANEAKTMILGAIAFLAYAWIVSRLLMRREYPVLATTSLSLLVWLVCALGLKMVILR